jgi:4-alpha-glucanotransferase
MNDALHRLAAAAGVESGYWDALGTYHVLTDDCAAAILRAQGFDPDGDPDREARRLAEETWRAPLPPAVVLREGVQRLWIALAAPFRDRAVAWTLELESGETRSGHFVAAQLEQRGACEVAGAEHAQFALPLDPPLPPGYHSFSSPDPPCRSVLIVAPERCFIPDDLAGGARRWGFAVQLYALRSSTNWGIGDFADLTTLAVAAARGGASFVGLNPLHARCLARPEEASPYAPSSRQFLDPVYIAVEEVPGFATCAEALALVAAAEFVERKAAARAAPLVQHAAIVALKLPVLDALFRAFCERPPEDPLVLDFHAYVAAMGAPLARFAEFEVLALDLVARNGSLPPLEEWPAEWRDPDDPGMAAFRRAAAKRIAFHCWLQWLARTQVDAAASAAHAAGMAVGLYVDLAVGAGRDSAENWSDPQLRAQQISVGAPPDAFSRRGQNWGIAPWNPRALRARAYAPFAALIAANMRHAGALRIDHVMALARLYWIPVGSPDADGAYVRNAFDVLTAVVAVESARHRCMVIGEDLGSVPDGLRERLAALGFLSYRVLLFERHWNGDGSFKRPWEYPAQALAIATTHDTPTVAELWSGGDAARRDALALFADARMRDEAVARGARERDDLAALLAELRLAPQDSGNPEEVAEVLHASIARTNAMLAVVQLDDLVAEREPINIPGTHHEYPNFRRKLHVPIETIITGARWARLAQIMRESGRV